MSNRWKIVLVLVGVALLAAALVIVRYGSQRETRLIALDAQTGRVLWSVGLGDDETGGPVASGKLILLNHGPSTAGYDAPSAWELAAFDAATGRKVWGSVPQSPAQLFGLQDTDPLADDRRVVIALDGATLGVYDAATGAQLQTIEGVSATWTQSREIPAALAADRLIAMGRREPDKVFAKDVRAIGLQRPQSALAGQSALAQQAALFWQTPYSDAVEFPHTHDPLTVSGALVFVAAYDRLEVYDLSSGAPQYGLKLGCNEVQGIGPLLYCGSEKSLQAIDAATGEERWTFPPSPLPRGSSLRFASVQAIAQAVAVTSYHLDGPNESRLYVLDPGSGGKPRWIKQMGDDGVVWDEIARIRPVPAQDALIAYSSFQGQPALVALAAADGAERWRFPVGDVPVYDPAYADGRVFIVDRAPRFRIYFP